MLVKALVQLIWYSSLQFGPSYKVLLPKGAELKQVNVLYQDNAHLSQSDNMMECP